MTLNKQFDTVAYFNSLVASNPGLKIDDNRCFVRLRTARWSDKRGIYETKQITWLKRASSGYQCLRENISDVGLEHSLDRIENLYECPDGIYEAVACNHTYDVETGYVDDWDFCLIPVEFYGPPIKLWLNHCKNSM